MDLPTLVRAVSSACVVVGHFCATDATPFEDSETERTAVVVATREEAETWLLWYPDGEIVPVREKS